MTTESLLDSGTLEPVTTIAKRITGKRPSPATVWRWAHKGMCGGSVRLAWAKHSGCLVTTEAAFRDFITAQTEQHAARAAERPDDDSDDALRAAGLL